MLILEIMFKSLAIVATILVLAAVASATVQASYRPRNRRVARYEKKRSQAVRFFR